MEKCGEFNSLEKEVPPGLIPEFNSWFNSGPEKFELNS